MRWVAYQTAYLKTHYPVEFMAALLTSETSKPDSVVKYIGECREMGIRVEPPDVQVSGAQFTPHGEAIRFGLAAVKNVGGNAIESILKARAEVGGRFKSFWEFCEKVDLRVMNKRVIESLIKAGALDSLGTRGQLMAAVDKAMERAQKAQRDAEQGQSGLFGLFDETPARGRDADALPAAADWEEGERLANEKEVLGFFVSGHPLDKYAEKLRNLTGVITTAEALERKPPERRWGAQPDMADEIQVAGIIHGLRVQKSRRDQRLYAQASLEDATGKIELICFARDYERLAAQLKIEAPVLVRGTLMGDEDAAPKIAVSQVQALEEVQVKLPAGVRIRINLDRATEEMLAAIEERRGCRAGAGQGDAAAREEGRVRGDSGAGRDERGGGPRLGGTRGRAGRQRVGAGGGIERRRAKQQAHRARGASGSNRRNRGANHHKAFAALTQNQSSRVSEPRYSGRRDQQGAATAKT